jgi:PhzF family phenazine biosynthesis protein
MLATEEMQRIAAWTNLSETTFLLPPSSNQADYRLRIFSPKQEMPFAGHPTVGSAHAVIESGYATSTDGKLRQECLAGILDLAVDETALGKQIFVQAPQPTITAMSGALTTALMGALAVVPASGIEFLRIDLGVVWIVADVGDAGSVAALRPDMAAVAKLSASINATGVTVFGRAADGISALHVRSFAPSQGIPEDPVCGSGNASVAAFLLHTGKLNDFGSKYVARQGMQVGRDGQVAVRVDGDRIWIGGYAVTCVDGSLRIK